MYNKGKKTSFFKSLRFKNMHLFSHLLMVFWCLITLFPVYMMISNSFKNKAEIYKNTFGLPKSFTISNYEYVFGNSQFIRYFLNSFIVVVISLFLILFLGSLCSYALAHWNSKPSRIIYFVIIIGMMLPIKIASIRLLEMMKTIGLLNSIWALPPIYVALGTPIAIFILTEFIRGLPNELYEAAFVDGASRFKIYRKVALPLLGPALATVAIYNLVPLWNDIWFPLIFITDENNKTLLLAVTKLQGQYTTDWPKVLAVLALSALPVMALYITMSKQFISGLTAGAVKG